MAISASITSAFNANAGLSLLINQFMSIERRPLTSLNTKKASITTTIYIYSDLKSNLTILLAAARDFTPTPTPTPIPDPWKPGETVSSAWETLTKAYEGIIELLIWFFLVFVPIFGPPALIIWIILN